MNIDYEKLYQEALRNSDFTTDLGFTKALIKAYEAQKAPPEWVPLDLATVKQGQEVRYSNWSEDAHLHEFVCTYKGNLFTAYKDAGLTIRGSPSVEGWLMRAPKPKTVRVKVYTRAGAKEPIVVRETFPVSDDCILIGEGDAEVRE